MRGRPTLILLLLVIGAIAYILISEREQPTTEENQERSALVALFRPENISYIEIANAGERSTLRRDNPQRLWMVNRPPAGDLADPDAVADLLNRLRHLPALRKLHETDILPAGKIDPKEFGFKDTQQSIELRGDGPRRTLLFGEDNTAGTGTFVMLKDSKEVCLIDSAIRKTVFRPPAEYRDPLFTRVPAADFTRLQIKRPDGAMEMTLEDGYWRITKPLETPADSQKVYETIAKFTTLHIADIVSDDLSALETHGLAPATATTITLATGNPGDQPLVLTLGADLPPPADKLLHALSPARKYIYSLPAAARELANATPDDLRDRRLIGPHFDDITDILIQPANAPEILLRHDTNQLWWLGAGNRPAPVQQTTAAELIKTFDEAKVSGFLPVTSTPAALIPDPPALKITLTGRRVLRGLRRDSATGKMLPPETVPVRATLAIGPTDPATQQAPVRRQSEATLVTIPAALLDKIPAQTWQWKPLPLFHRPAADIEQITLNGATLARDPQGAWQLTAPAPDARKPLPQALDTLALALGNLRAVRWIAGAPAPAHALDTPSIQLTWKLKDLPAPFTLTVAAHPDPEGFWPATITPQGQTTPPEVFLLSQPDVDTLKLDLLE